MAVGNTDGLLAEGVIILHSGGLGFKAAQALFGGFNLAAGGLNLLIEFVLSCVQGDFFGLQTGHLFRCVTQTLADFLLLAGVG